LLSLLIIKQNLILPSKDSTFVAEISFISPDVFSGEVVVFFLLSSSSTMIDLELPNAAI
jgi:hypothetical protein